MAHIFCFCNFFALDAHEIWSQDSRWLAEPVQPFILRCLYPTWKLELCDWLTRVNVEMNSTTEQERLCGTHLVWIFKTSILYNKIKPCLAFVISFVNKFGRSQQKKGFCMLSCILFNWDWADQLWKSTLLVTQFWNGKVLMSNTFFIFFITNHKIVCHFKVIKKLYSQTWLCYFHKQACHP